MRYAILGFNQERVLNLQKEHNGKVKKLDVTDLLILKDIADFMNRSKIIKYTIDDKVYFSVQYSAIIEDLPLIDIKKQALSDRLDKMCILGVLEKKVIKNQSGTFVAFRMGCEYESLIYEPTSSEVRVQEYSTTNQNTTITNNNREDKEVIEDKSSITKKEGIDYALLASLWNANLQSCTKISKLERMSDKRKKAVKSLLNTCDSNVEEFSRLIMTLPYADDWVLGTSTKGWVISFDWLIANTSNWYVRALEGEMHKKNAEMFKRIMAGEVPVSTPTENKDTICINGQIYR